MNNNVYQNIANPIGYMYFNAKIPYPHSKKTCDEYLIFIFSYFDVGSECVKGKKIFVMCNLDIVWHHQLNRGTFLYIMNILRIKLELYSGIACFESQILINPTKFNTNGI